MKCLECGKEFKSITHAHLKHHNLTRDEYLLKYNLQGKDITAFHPCPWKGKNAKDFYKDPKAYEEKINKSISKYMHRAYKEGLRDKFEITKKANEKCRELVKNNKFVLQKENRNFEPWFDDKTSDLYKRTCKKISNSEYHKNGTWVKQMDKYPLLVNPMALLGKKTRNSYPQQKLFEIIKKYFKKTTNKYYIKNKITNKHFKYPDIYIPELNICVEYDGLKWHNDINRDLERDKIFIKQGYKMLHYRGSFPDEYDVVNDIISLKESSINAIYKEKDKTILIGE
ncbi:MAG: hypothetical protein EOL97_09490 [Spirochaetia bacterium]|nr:hypothetical protein [Spirochaetia bacterium]